MYYLIFVKMFLFALNALCFALNAPNVLFMCYALIFCAISIFCCLFGRVKVRDTAPGAGCSWVVSPPGGVVHRPSAVVFFFYFAHLCA